ncbi:anhydro-N-acetylmuramic acid kinase [Phytoactinopolyspora sp. XMNu-373]|uniref:Anhydro-N-acetylmuramic acid kinase n=1 Tax=Phytoactinopolyspora mesophila TaxID=2650750 RepID=A0A7K3LY38_9ACTN|nr:anhydro-N-acetylmuramic acid kinase [Phytoactinopolyspora mesophila]
MTVLGMISGTSHDGIDVAVVDFTLDEGNVLHGTVRHTASPAYDAALRARLRSTLPPAEIRYADVCELDTLIGQAFAGAAASAAAAVGGVDLGCSHGQTVYHWVDRNRALGTLQIGQPAWIADRLGVPVISDVRIRDIVSGGQGAPLVSLLDLLLLAGLTGRAAALNLGGISNITVLQQAGRHAPVAYDVGPANALIDAAVLAADPDGPGYDVDGRIAATGTVRGDLLAELLGEPYYALTAPKTTGKELFHAGYLAEVLSRHPGIDATGADHADVVATLTALTARTVAAEVRSHNIDTLVVSGGGWLNPTLRAMLAAEMPEVALRSSAELGAPVGAKEAIAFALIGWHTWHGLPGSVPSCTGAGRASVLGTVTPGAGPLRLPAALQAAPSALVLDAGN